MWYTSIRNQGYGLHMTRHFNCPYRPPAATLAAVGAVYIQTPSQSGGSRRQARPRALLTCFYYATAARLGTYDPKPNTLSYLTKSFGGRVYVIACQPRQIRTNGLRHRVSRAKTRLDMHLDMTQIVVGIIFDGFWLS